MSTLSRLTDLLRGTPRIDPDELRSYEQAIRPILDHLAGIFVRWRESLELDSPQDELANAASIQRWEAANLIDLLHQVPTPAPLLKAHGELEALALSTARAAQLLSNGYRFHSSNARCDGQALMLTSEQRFQSLCRTLERSGLSVSGAGGVDAPGDASPGS
jgi:hypothetical protein